MEQVDIALRHVVERYPEQLAEAIVPDDLRLRFSRWLDVPVESAEPRLYRALELRRGARRRILQVELVATLTDHTRFQVFEHTSMLVSTVREAELGAPPPIESVVVVLCGPAEPQSRAGELRISWPESKFSGVRYRIEHVYQRTVEELMQQGPLWLAFTPLAVDATADAMREVIAAIVREEPDEEGQADLVAALLQMAEIDPWRHNLRKEIAMMVEALDMDVVMKSQTLREAFDRGYEEGLIRVLQRLFQRGVGRPPTDAERDLLLLRIHAVDGEDVADAALDLAGDALATWLLGTSNGDGTSA